RGRGVGLPARPDRGGDLGARHVPRGPQAGQTAGAAQRQGAGLTTTGRDVAHPTPPGHGGTCEKEMTMSTAPYDYATIRAAWDSYTPLRVRYSADETGWALRLDADHVCLANVPLTDDLFEMDICELEPGADPASGDLRTVGRVVQRYYTQRALLRYVPLDDQEELLRRYRNLAAMLRARDCAIEGVVPGAAQVQA